MHFNQEKVCTNWYMHKKGKTWVFGCSALLLGLMLASGTTAAADDQVIESSTESSTSSLATRPDQDPIEDEDVSTPKPTPVEETAAGQADQSLSDPRETSSSELDQSPLLEEQADPQGSSRSATSEERSVLGYDSDLTAGRSDQHGDWKIVNDGLYSNARGRGDSFYYSDRVGTDFVYSTDVTFLQDEGAAALVFRAQTDQANQESYAVNIDGSNHQVKFWRWQAGRDLQLISEKAVKATEDKRYRLKVVAIGPWISYYVNDELVANLGDYTLQREDKGQATYRPNGQFALLNWNGEVLFQHTHVQDLTPDTAPVLKNIQVEPEEGQVEPAGQLSTPVAIRYVSNEAKKVDLKIEARNPATRVQVTDSSGRIYTDAKDIPLTVGSNLLTITVTQGDAQLVYRLNVHRRRPAEAYYNELYRDQYHYSVKDGWANDPNGLVYYKGRYHFFYQFYDDTKWGPMHWGHATSSDLLHWQEEPVALYPDENGTMFSGSIVVDDHNTSGLFDSPEGGLVALITADGNGQRMKLAYSQDEGKTWKKVDQIAADWTADPLQSPDFRDPKVFGWENKWFMVLAGGPLRIYSSENLKEWQVESTYADLHTECPDLYPLQADDGQIKWVLSRGGRSYKVGDFQEVAGKWTFVPDADFSNRDEVMNFGKDSYAAMTYYVQDFGTRAHPTLPAIIESNWMNTWEDYCNLVAERTGQAFNGTFNLNLKVGLKKTASGYRLTQTPIQAYESLRQLDRAIHYENVTIAEKNALFTDFKGDQYELLAHIQPGQGTTKVGFNLRQGEDGQVTKVVYDIATSTLSIDRSQSGIILSQKFAQVDHQLVERHADGSLDLRIFVDRASVEVFAQGGMVAGANQIFTAPTSLGLSVFSEGAASQATIHLYPLASTWADKVEVQKPIELIQVSPKDQTLYVGDQASLSVYVAPGDQAQDVQWRISDPSLVKSTVKGNQLQIEALKEGETSVTVHSVVDPSLEKEFTIHIRRNDFKTNLSHLESQVGSWYIDGTKLMDENVSRNDAYMSTQALSYADYQLDLDMTYSRGLINLFYASEKTDPGRAYSIQFGDSDRIRLYRFGGETIAEAAMEGRHLNDGQPHHVTLIKKGNDLTVAVDGVDYLKHHFDQVEEYYVSPFVGLGLWDGNLAVENLYVTNLHLDTEALQEAVNQAGNKEPGTYTQDSFEAYRSALARAQAVLRDRSSSQEMVDQALQNLQAALQGLTEKPVTQTTPDQGVKNLEASNPQALVEEVDLAFETSYRENPNMTKGVQKVVVPGQTGTKRLIYSVDGSEKTLVFEEILEQPKHQVIEIGTKEDVPQETEKPAQQLPPQSVETPSKDGQQVIGGALHTPTAKRLPSLSQQHQPDQSLQVSQSTSPTPEVAKEPNSTEPPLSAGQPPLADATAGHLPNTGSDENRLAVAVGIAGLSLLTSYGLAKRKDQVD